MTGMGDAADSVACTLITPLYNERDNVEQLWDAIHGQTRPPAEWIITDNGSTDGTYEWLKDRAEESPLRVVVLSLPGKTIAEMQNQAVESASHSIIASCHGGTQVPLTWLEAITRPFGEDPSIEVVAGRWKPVGETAFERRVVQAMVIEFRPSSRRWATAASRSLAFRRSVWEKVGGVPEWLPMFGEDTLFGVRLRAAGCRWFWAEDAVVGWRPKSTLRSLVRQYRLYQEADSLMGLGLFGFTQFLRPWLFVLIGVLAGLITGNLSVGVGAFAIATLADYIRARRSGVVRRFGDYVLWVWLIRPSQQAGWVRGRLQRLSIPVPESDRNAIRRWHELRRTPPGEGQAK